MTLDDYNKPRSEIEKAIDEWIFNQLHREILKSRLLDGLTYEALGEKYNLSTQRIKSIVYKAQDKLFRHL